MKPSEYQAWCRRFDNHYDHRNESALVFGLCAEAGEVAGEYEKWLRTNGPEHDEVKPRVALELGDVMWNVARLADVLGYGLEEIMQMNINKLIARYDERGISLSP